MKKEDFVKLGLDEETAKKCEAASTEELKGFIPKSRFDEVNNEKKKLELDVRDRDGQIETLKNTSGDAAEWKKKAEEFQAENKRKDDEHKAEIKQLKIDSAIDTAIANAKGKNAKAIKALLDMEKISVDKDGNVVGHTEQLETLTKAEDSKFMFDTVAKKTQVKGATPGESGNESSDGKVDTSKMTYSELAAYMAENPDVKID